MRKKTNNWADADVAHGERAARQVLAELRLSRPFDVDIDDIAWLRGALVKDIPMSGAQGRCCRVGTEARISVNQQVKYLPRRRYIVAHELGHLEIHRDRNQLALCTEQDIGEDYDQGTEREANAFASELLMPRSLWEKCVDIRQPTLDIVAELADRFQVSLTAAALRFVKLCPERCAIAFAREGRVVWSALSPDFGYSIRRDNQISTYALASDYFRNGAVGSRPETVSAEAWIDSKKVGSDHDLREHCRALPSLGATLSLLWIPPDADF